MDMKDVAAISYEKSFNKKWWESKRSSALKGSGVGKALDEWQKNCKKPIPQMIQRELEAAESTCAALRKALKGALAKCGDKQKETVAGCKKYLQLVNDFSSDVADRAKKIGNDMTSMSVALEGFATKIVPTATKRVNDAAASLPERRKKIQPWLALAAKPMTDKEKETLLKTVEDEQKALAAVLEDIGAGGEIVKKGLEVLEKTLAECRKQPQFRPALAKHAKTVAVFQDVWDIRYNDCQDVQNEVLEVFVALTKTATSDGAAEAMKEKAKVLKVSPQFMSLGENLTMCKEWVAAIVEFQKNPQGLTDQQWDKVEFIERELKAAVTTSKGNLRIMERWYKPVPQLYAAWKSNPTVADNYRKAATLYQEYKAAFEKFQKLAPAVQAALDKLYEQR
ncbi:MAG: hypothetical protein NTY19_50375 [Planctomycetota bacterium]|nr:hypothetical protein [Planctomycetota bacterium]